MNMLVHRGTENDNFIKKLQETTEQLQRDIKTDSASYKTNRRSKRSQDVLLENVTGKVSKGFKKDKGES